MISRYGEFFVWKIFPEPAVFFQIEGAIVDGHSAAILTEQKIGIIVKSKLDQLTTDLIISAKKNL